LSLELLYIIDKYKEDINLVFPQMVQEKDIRSFSSRPRTNKTLHNRLDIKTRILRNSGKSIFILGYELKNFSLPIRPVSVYAI